MRFQVPQFIEVEDKIFGPLTLKQFIYLAGGAGICATAWFFTPRFIAVLIGAPVAVLSISLAFVHINNRPFIYVLEAFVNYSIRSKLYIWNKNKSASVNTSNYSTVNSESALYIPKMGESKLKELTWNLDVHENQNPVTGPEDEKRFAPQKIQTMQGDIEQMKIKK